LERRIVNSKYVVLSVRVVLYTVFLCPGSIVHCIFGSNNSGQKPGQKSDQTSGQKSNQKSSQKTPPKIWPTNHEQVAE